MTSDPGSFARRTIVERKPQIIAQVLGDHAYPAEIVAALETLRQEIAGRPMQPLRENAPDVDFWNGELAAHTGKTWLEVPWYFAETFFYRKLLEVVGYFRAGDWQGIDPFAKQKSRQITHDVQRAADEWASLADLPPQDAFEVLIHSCLWGNRTDLSNFTVTRRGFTGVAARADRHRILIDDTAILGNLLAGGLPRLDFINDNCGIDFLTDLALADFLLQRGWAGQIVMHLKPQPFFVSDVMPADAAATLHALQRSESAPLQQLGGRLQGLQAEGKLHFTHDSFWATCLMFRQMPAALRAELAQSSLVLLKGDVNYRRLLDDRHWPHTARMETIAAYFPAPFATLRTLKGEIMVGLQPGQAERLAAEDPAWLIDGQRGVIQFVDTKDAGAGCLSAS
ncbi:MAG: damage-control phosphatase ARMT1 family protein [Chloroflexota bacterium]